jgi:Tfp pilus assembly protein FimV
MAVLFAANANAVGTGGIQENSGETQMMQIAPILLASAEQSQHSANGGGKKKIKPSDKLSLSLSMTLSIPGNASTQPGNSAKTSDAPQAEAVAKEKRLSELNAQIADAEIMIQAQQRQLANLDNPPKTPPNTPSNPGVVGASVAAQGEMVGNVPDADREKIKPQIAVPDVQSEGNELLGQIEALKIDQIELAAGLGVLLLTSLGFVWYRKGQSARQETRQLLKMESDVPEDADSAKPAVLTKSSVSIGERSMKVPAYTEQKSRSILPPEYEMLEEADIYLRFGHDKLAEEALREAIKINPTNPQAYLTLSRLYFSREDSVAFLALAKQLKSLSDKNDWNKVAEMGRNLDPNNTFYS